jgi:hypothetical protein
MVVNGRFIDLGRRAGGGRFRLPSPGHGMVHVLISGKTDSGKSSTMAKVIGELAAWPNVAFCGIDHKAGLELEPWAPRFTEVSTTINHTEDLLGRLVELVDDRGRQIRQTAAAENRTIRSWEDSMGPRIVVPVDEAAEVTRSKAAIDLLDSLTARSRALGIHVVCATQYGLAQSFPSTLLLNLTARICHRMGTTAQYATALAMDQGELRDHGFEPIPEHERFAGVCYVAGIRGMGDLSRCRTDLVTEDTIDRRARQTADRRWEPAELFGPQLTVVPTEDDSQQPDPTITLADASPDSDNEAKSSSAPLILFPGATGGRS